MIKKTFLTLPEVKQLIKKNRISFDYKKDLIIRIQIKWEGNCLILESS